MRTALVAIGRCENQYAREWVQHHLAQGFDHIYIYDNNHKDEEYFEDVLGDFIAPTSSVASSSVTSLSIDSSSVASSSVTSLSIDSSSVASSSIAGDAIADPPVTIIPYRNRESAQRSAYNDAYARFGQNYDWLSFFDFDEFLCFATVPDASPSGLKPFLATIPQNYHAVMIPWLMMTDSGLIHNDHRPLMTRFTESTPNGSRQGKCIIRTRIPGLRFTRSVHVPYEPVLNCCTPRLLPTPQKRHQPQDTTVAYLKHFSTKTIEEWLTNKWQKGAAGIPYATFLQKYQDYFFRINERTPEKEAFIQEWQNNIITK